MSAAEDERELRALQQVWMQAWADQDLATIERILAPDYALVVSGAPDRAVSRAEWIAMLPRYTTQGFSYSAMQVRLFGDFAMVSSLGTPHGATIDGVDRSFTFFLVDAWRRDPEGWRVVSRYSALPESAAAAAPR